MEPSMAPVVSPRRGTKRTNIHSNRHRHHDRQVFIDGIVVLPTSTLPGRQNADLRFRINGPCSITLQATNKIEKGPPTAHGINNEELYTRIPSFDGCGWTCTSPFLKRLILVLRDSPTSSPSHASIQGSKRTIIASLSPISDAGKSASTLRAEVRLTITA